jgi:hypothetical protein
MFNKNQFAVDHFNDKYVNDCKEVLDLIQLHYLTNKENTLFWSEFKNKNKISESLTKKINIINNSILLQEDVGKMFPSDSYYLITKGMNILNLDNIKSIYSSLSLDKFEASRNNQKEKQDIVSNLFLKHHDFLKNLGGLND